MKKNSDEPSDELRREYDFSTLKVVARGRDRKSKFVVELAPDVAKEFPTAEAVNEALRSVLKTRANQAKPA